MSPTRAFGFISPGSSRFCPSRWLYLSRGTERRRPTARRVVHFPFTTHEWGRARSPREKGWSPPCSASARRAGAARGRGGGERALGVPDVPGGESPPVSGRLSPITAESAAMDLPSQGSRGGEAASQINGLAQPQSPGRKRAEPDRRRCLRKTGPGEEIRPRRKPARFCGFPRPFGKVFWTHTLETFLICATSRVP